MISKHALALTVAATLLSPLAVSAQGTDTPSKEHSHSHSHDHSEGSKEIYKGYFKDSQIEARTLSDWEGDWQSVYPYLLDGSLDPVMAHKAEDGGKSAKDYRDEYATGYKTDVNRIVIKGETVTFFRDGKPVEANYVSDGFEILTYKKGNRGVRYIFKKSGGEATAPEFIQFSDHTIAPAKAGHFHLFWGNDRSAVLQELSNWPTYYPAPLDAKAIVHEMLEH
jgi:zinc transport system substrate-binding protein